MVNEKPQTNCSRDHEGLMLLLPKLTLDTGEGAQPIALVLQ